MIYGVWLGGAPLSELAQRCIATWPAHEVVSRARLSSVVSWLLDIEYFRDAYDRGHWAGASDVARLALLYELGGTYLDVDVEVIDAPALEALDPTVCHLGLEDSTNVCGAVIKAPAKHPFIGHMLDVYRATKFADTFNGKCNGTTLLTKAVREHIEADAGWLTVHPPEVFYPGHWSNKITVAPVTNNTITVHHWAHSWSQVNA